MTSPSETIAKAEEPRPKFLILVAPDAKTVISGMASKETHFAIRTEGPFGLKEMRNIIKLLEAHIAVAEQDEDQP